MTTRELDLIKFKDYITKSSKITESESEEVLNALLMFLGADEVDEERGRILASLNIETIKKFGMSVTAWSRQTSTLNAFAVAFNYKTWGELKESVSNGDVSLKVVIFKKDK